jgi:hypothetical protein
MLSRRVFEILACRTPVVSAPSAAMEELFDGVVPTPHDSRSAHAVLAGLLDDPLIGERLGHLGFRTVMTSHTYQHRVGTVCEALGIDRFPDPSLPDVDAVLEIATSADTSRALATVAPLRQCLDAVVIVCRDLSDPSALHIESRGADHLVHVGTSVSNRELLARLPGSAEMVAFIDVEARYGPAAITDALLATRFAVADVYGKSSSHVAIGHGARAIGDGREFCVATDLIDGTAIVRRSALPPKTDSARGTSLSQAAIATSTRRFAVDRFNHVTAARDVPTTGTTRALTDVVF